MPFFQLPEEIIFPSPHLAEPDGLLAIGGDLSTERLLAGYSLGIFPWYGLDDPILWWSPDPRMVVFPEKFHCSKSLAREIKSNKFEVRFDCNFRKVIELCGNTRLQNGAWISPDIIEAYTNLHSLGYAHSIETYYQNELVGGLYGVSIGKIFFGESMFHTMANASKVAFYHLIMFAREHGFYLIDAQVETPHLASLGAETISREKFMEILSFGLKAKGFSIDN